MVEVVQRDESTHSPHQANNALADAHAEEGCCAAHLEGDDQIQAILHHENGSLLAPRFQLGLELVVFLGIVVELLGLELGGQVVGVFHLPVVLGDVAEQSEEPEFLSPLVEDLGVLVDDLLVGEEENVVQQIVSKITQMRAGHLGLITDEEGYGEIARRRLYPPGAWS